MSGPDGQLYLACIWNISSSLHACRISGELFTSHTEKQIYINTTGLLIIWSKIMKTK